MGRKTVNKFEEATIAFKKGTEFRLFDVKLPNSVTVTYRVQIGAKKDGSLIYGTTTTDVNLPVSEKKKIINDFKNAGYKVLKVEPQTVKWTDLCPNCSRRGIPKIERVDTKDRRVRNWKYREEKPIPKRPDEHWLTYDHKDKPKKCRIQQFIYVPYPSYKKNTRKQFDIQKYFFPNVLEKLQFHDST